MPDDPGPAERLIDAMCAGTVDAVTFTSQPAVHHLFRIAEGLGRADALRAACNDALVPVCVGPVCADAALAEGITRPQWPDPPRLAAMVRLVASALGSREGLTVPSFGGWVSIVGAGPGDPDLITVRGKAALDAADVVVHDRLVHPDLIAGRVAIDVGKQPGCHPVPQDGINALLVSLAREGKRVVRLKGGDPFLLGRGSEEAEALAAAGVAYEVVPGPTSALAVLAYAGIPATDRRYGSSIAVVSGHSAAGQAGDWDACGHGHRHAGRPHGARPAERHRRPADGGRA